MTLEQRIRHCPSLTPAEEQLAAYILTHGSAIPSATIQSLAEQTYLSVSSIHRFCRKLGLKGFKDLKREALSLSASPTGEPVDVNFPFSAGDSFPAVSHSLHQLYRSTLADTLSYAEEGPFILAARLLDRSESVEIYTHAHNLYPAEAFADRMLSIGKQVRCPADFYSQRALALASGPRHAALLISFSGRASFLPTVLNILRQRGCPVILVGKAGLERDFPRIRYFLPMSDREAVQERISQFSSHLSLQFLLDLLYCCIFQLDHEKNLALLRENLSLLDDRRFF